MVKGNLKRLVITTYELDSKENPGIAVMLNQGKLRMVPCISTPVNMVCFFI